MFEDSRTLLSFNKHVLSPTPQRATTLSSKAIAFQVGADLAFVKNFHKRESPVCCFPANTIKQNDISRLNIHVQTTTTTTRLTAQTSKEITFNVWTNLDFRTMFIHITSHIPHCFFSTTTTKQNKNNHFPGKDKITEDMLIGNYTPTRKLIRNMLSFNAW